MNLYDLTQQFLAHFLLLFIHAKLHEQSFFMPGYQDELDVIPFNKSRKLKLKDSFFLKSGMKSEAIKELEKLEGAFIRLGNLAALRKNRIKNSDEKGRGKMEGYMHAFTYAAELVNRAIINLKKKEIIK